MMLKGNQINGAEVKIKEETTGGYNYKTYTSSIVISESGFVEIGEEHKIVPQHKVLHITF